MLEELGKLRQEMRKTREAVDAARTATQQQATLNFDYGLTRRSLADFPDSFAGDGPRGYSERLW